MPESVIISVDALGGDHAPDVVLEGVEAALAEDAELGVILCGPREVVEPFAAEHERCVARPTTEEISMAVPKLFPGKVFAAGSVYGLVSHFRNGPELAGVAKKWMLGEAWGRMR